MEAEKQWLQWDGFNVQDQVKAHKDVYRISEKQSTNTAKSSALNHKP